MWLLIECRVPLARRRATHEPEHRAISDGLHSSRKLPLCSGFGALAARIVLLPIRQAGSDACSSWSMLHPGRTYARREVLDIPVRLGVYFHT